MRLFYFSILLSILTLSAGQLSAQGTNSTKVIDRAAYLVLPAEQQSQVDVMTIRDLINMPVPPKYADGRFYITVDEFAKAGPKQLHILQHSDRYLIIPNGVAKPKNLISRHELEGLSPEKRQMIEQSSEFEISE